MPQIVDEASDDCILDDNECKVLLRRFVDFLNKLLEKLPSRVGGRLSLNAFQVRKERKGMEFDDGSVLSAFLSIEEVEGDSPDYGTPIERLMEMSIRALRSLGDYGPMTVTPHS